MLTGLILVEICVCPDNSPVCVHDKKHCWKTLSNLTKQHDLKRKKKREKNKKRQQRRLKKMMKKWLEMDWVKE